MEEITSRNIFVKVQMHILHFIKLHAALKIISLKVISSLIQVYNTCLIYPECSLVMCCLLVEKSFYCIQNNSVFYILSKVNYKNLILT